jgi:hypothetical protein
LVIVLVDQLDDDSAGFDGFDAEKTPGGLDINP